MVDRLRDAGRQLHKARVLLLIDPFEFVTPWDALVTDGSIHAVSGACQYYTPGTKDMDILCVLQSWAILQSQEAASSRRLPKHARKYLRSVLPPDGLWHFLRRNYNAIQCRREEQSICFRFRDEYLKSIGAASDARSETSWFSILEEQIEDKDASQWPSWHEVSTTQEHEDSRTNASGNPKGEEVDHLLATNVSASGGLGEEEGSSFTNASLVDSRNAGALQNFPPNGWQWRGPRSWRKGGWRWDEWNEWRS